MCTVYKLGSIKTILMETILVFLRIFSTKFLEALLRILCIKTHKRFSSNLFVCVQAFFYCYCFGKRANKKLISKYMRTVHVEPSTKNLMNCRSSQDRAQIKYKAHFGTGFWFRSSFRLPPGGRRARRRALASSPCAAGARGRAACARRCAQTSSRTRRTRTASRRCACECAW